MPPQKLPARSHARLIRVCCKDGYPTKGGTKVFFAIRLLFR